MTCQRKRKRSKDPRVDIDQGDSQNDDVHL